MKLKRAPEYRRLLLRTRPKRYVNLFRTIYERRCRSIVEIGTWNGVHAEEMIRTAAAHSDIRSVRYSGFDLFEDLTDEQSSSNSPSAPHLSSGSRAAGANRRLIRGNTRDTLPRATEILRNADLVFIDGGHSIETIAADWMAIRDVMGPATTVVFDDYYPNAGPELAGLGCHSLIDQLDPGAYAVEVLEPTDEFEQSWGALRVRMARVTLVRST
ncbi:MAG: class I SAM-dependent methyltransferase [Gemmatimonadales bacterium]|nr:class I SAM-dependent methyltransferase [Gemmatimonadales bacterium]